MLYVSSTLKTLRPASLFVLLLLQTGCVFQSYIDAINQPSSLLRPTKMVITQNPTNANSMADIPLIVELRDEADQVVNVSDLVTISIHTDASGATAGISGTISVQAVAGIATFTGVKLDLPATGYVLRISATGLPAVTSTPFNISAQVAAVAAMYPTNGANLLAFVANDVTKKRHQLTDTACPNTYTDFYHSCVHGGEIRKVELPGWSSCQGLTLTEQLDAFEWICVDASPAYFYSRGFKRNKGLKTVTDASAFLPNRVTIAKSGVTIAQSVVSTTWWTNPVQNLTLNSGGADAPLSLATANTIYTISATGTSRGITFANDNVALVILGSNVLSPTGALASDCNPSQIGTQSCFIYGAGGRKRGWVEGNINMTLAFPAIWISDFGSATGGWRLHNLNITGTGAFTGIYFEHSAEGYYVSDTKISGNGNGYGIFKEGGGKGYIHNSVVENMNSGIFSFSTINFHQKLNNVRVSNCTATGITAPNWYNYVINSRVYNNGQAGVRLTGNFSFVSGSIVSNNGSHGIETRGDNDVAMYSTIANNLATGFYVQVASTIPKTTFEGVLATNNVTGIENRSDNGGFKNIISTNNGTGIIIGAASTGNHFTGKLVLGNTADCSITTSGLNPGLSGVACNNQNTSDAVRVPGISAANYFEGAIGLEPLNVHATGIQLANAITDWLTFSNPFRIWGLEGTQSNSAIRGRCTGAVNCRIWDWTLVPTAIEALDVNGTMTNALTCPAAIHGDNIFSYYNVSGATTALRSALEIMDDDLGNEDGFCNSGEACYFTPHIGAYQGGSGAFTKQCTFVNGAVVGAITNVTMYGW